MKAVVRETVTVSKHLNNKALALFDEDGDDRISFDEFVRTIEKLRGNLNGVWDEESER